MTKRKIEYWVIRPDADGEFVAHMEEVLDTYETAYDPDRPVVCIDEQPVQLIGETRAPIPATKEHAECVGYESERKGTASIFMFAKPLSGFRQAMARPRRTGVDWVHEVAELFDGRYADREQIALVCDNLNTRMKGAFYKAFPPEKVASPTSPPSNRRSPPGPPNRRQACFIVAFNGALQLVRIGRWREILTTSASQRRSPPIRSLPPGPILRPGHPCI